MGIIDSKYASAYDRAAREPVGAFVYWHVADLNATPEQLLAKGATPVDGARERGAGFVTASVRDRFGNLLAVLYNPFCGDITTLEGDPYERMG